MALKHNIGDSDTHHWLRTIVVNLAPKPFMPVSFENSINYLELL